MSPSNDITKATSWHIAPDYYGGHWLVHAHVPDLEYALCFAKCQTREHAEFICARLVACSAIVGNPVQALHLTCEALSKILRHIPADSGGCSVSADVDLCRKALRALGA